MASRSTTSMHELESRGHSTTSVSTVNASETGINAGSGVFGEGIEQQLEPADGGAAAWRVLFAGFVFEAVLWGFCVSFGVFQTYYMKLPQFEGNPHLAVIGTMATGIPYLTGPITAAITRRYQPYRLYLICAGWLLCVLGVLGSSFAESLGLLVLTQGMMYGFGFPTFYFPILSLVSEWWIGRRGMAFGFMTSAAGASGIVMPLLIQTLLDKYGHRTTLQAIAVAMAVLTGPLIPLLKSRLPPSQVSTAAKTDWSFTSKPLFLVYCITVLAQSFGFLFPSLFLPSYATSIGLSARQGALLLSVMSAAQTVGQGTFGFLSDKIGVNILVVLSTVAAAVATLASWGIARDLAPLIVFSLLFGFFAYGFSSLRTRMSTAVSEDPTAALANYGVLCFCQGLGVVLAGPISGALLSGKVKRDSYGAARYRGLVMFTGACMLVSALSVGSWYIRPRRVRAGRT